MTATLRRIQSDDLEQIVRFPFTVSIREPLTDSGALSAAFEATGFWTDEAGAMAIVKDGRMVGTCQFYRAAPCIHGFELGYILHDPARRGHGLAPPAVKGFALGVFGTTRAAGFFIGGIVGGAVSKHFGNNAVFYVCAALAAIWFVAAFSMQPPPVKSKEK